MIKDKEFHKQKTPNHQSLKNKSGNRVHKPYDKYFKNVMSIAGEGFMKLIGYPIRITHIHNTEKINEISGELHIDSLIESDEPKMYINEFQTDPINEKDLRRFGSYQVLVFKETGLETIVNIISLDAKNDSDDLYGFGTYFNRDYTNNNPPIIEYGFTPHVKSLTNLDLSLYLNIMDEIVEINKKPDEYALAILFIIPFMTSDKKKRKDLIFKTDEIASKLNIKDKNLLIDIKNNQRLLAQEVLNGDEFKKFMGVRKVLSKEDINKLDNYEDIFFREIAWERAEERFKKIVKEELKEEVKEELKEEVKEELKEEVKEEVEENMVRKLLENGFSVESVLNCTSLSKSHVIALSNTIALK